LLLVNPVSAHLWVEPFTPHFPASGRQLFQGMITLRKREEASTLAKRRFIKYQTVRNNINIISNPNLHERTMHIALDEKLFHAVTKRLVNTVVESSFSSGNLKFILFLKTLKKGRSRH
jgi:hypothetical protein